ncbi:phosphoglucosamine mutase [Halobaculum sp. EA56]|uniref:phosphoglucosamine mutase n=1 Tax=Halobaculum sp. EA56 TaxID=3421648 RepID=UPI003EB6A2D0
MFGTSGIRGPFGDEVTADLALDVGRALASTGTDRLVIGRDPRDTGSLLADAASAGARERGADVTRLGVVSTPTLARSVAWRDADAGLMVTASHNPPQDNGLKLWTPSGRAFDGEQREEVSRVVREGDFAAADWDATGTESRWDGATERHRRHLVESFGSLDGVSVAVDLGNGAGGVTAAALRDLGCRVVTLNGQRDGRFPGRPSEPTAENCGDLRRFVADADVDLGIAHDGDADRMRAVTEEGEFVSGDVQLALFAREVVDAGDAVATPVDTSLVVDDVVAERGGSVVRTRVGDVFVAEAARDPEVVFGGEQSGTWIWPEETLCPDASYAACVLVSTVRESGPLSEAVASIDTYPVRRDAVETDHKDAVVERVADRLRDRHDAVDTTDGVRVETDDGWFLVRASGTEPIVRLTVEHRDEAGADERLADLTDLVREVGDRVEAGSTAT